MSELSKCGTQGKSMDRRLESIRDSSPDIGSDVNQQDLGNCQRGGNTQQLCESGHGLWDLRTQRVHNRLLQILRAQAALAHCLHHRSKLVVQQHNVSGLLGNLSATDAHCNTNFSSFQGRSVIDPITGHGYDSASNLLVRTDNHPFVNWGNARENTSMLDSLPPEVHLLFTARLLKSISVGHVISQLTPGDYCVPADVFGQICQFILLQDSNACGDGLGGRGVIPGHHHCLTACIVQHSNGFLHSLLRRVLKTNETHPSEPRHREIALLRAGSLEHKVVRVPVKAHFREAEHAPASGHQLVQAGVDFCSALVGELHG
mmetsp:Transcript_7364/g.15986  ORF Transcript_7364/g.15986 Transcript_7364/m.15986 type:complete len:317 (+) Transcript_7364:990-1940(+)